MNNSIIYKEYSVILSHSLYAIYKNTLVYSICLDKRGYDALNYDPCVSYIRKNKIDSNRKELDTNEPASKYLKLDTYADFISSLSM